MVSLGSGSYRVRFADLPGIEMLEEMPAFDVRSGWFDPNKGGKKKKKGETTPEPTATPAPDPSFVPDFQNPDPNPDADMDLGLAKGAGRGKGTVQICYQEQTMTVNRREFDILMAAGATLGPCGGTGEIVGGLSGGHFWLRAMQFATELPKPAPLYD